MQGRRFAHWAVRENLNSWFYDLSLQHANYTVTNTTSHTRASTKCEIVYDRAFDGTSSLRVSGSCPANGKCCVPLKPFNLDNDDPIIVYCVLEKASMKCHFGIFIETPSKKVLVPKHSIEGCIQDWEVIIFSTPQVEIIFVFK